MRFRKIQNRILPVKFLGRLVVGVGGALCAGKPSEINPLLALAWANERDKLSIGSFVSVSNTAIPGCRLRGGVDLIARSVSQSQVFSPVVKTITIPMINQYTVRGVGDKPVHQHMLLSFRPNDVTSRVACVGGLSNVPLATKLHNEIKVFVVNKRHVPFAQGDFFHEASSFLFSPLYHFRGYGG